ncbi:hypothetical protein AAE250_07770 [Bacteroides sp. GD17]|uniref:hypothetical protein n=1 Tax=Bacteroides sp. GD17 TaxID=3139826 RepID=UPI00313BE537
MLNTNSNGSSPAINCYPPNDDEGKQNNFDDSQYTITGLNSYVSTLNEGITGWNKDKQTTDAKYCNYHFDAGSSSDSTPPKLVEGAPE